MTKKLILCAPLAIVMSSCSLTQMGDVVPESRDTEFGSIAVTGFNTGSVITYGKNYKTGYMETAGVEVFHDSGIDNITKLAHAAGSVALGTGSVIGGIGSYKYGKAYEKFADEGFHFNHEGLGDTNINVEGSHANATSGSTSAADADAAAKAKAGASAGASADIRIKPKGGGHGGHKGGHGGHKGGYGKPGHGGGHNPYQ